MLIWLCCVFCVGSDFGCPADFGCSTQARDLKIFFRYPEDFDRNTQDLPSLKDPRFRIFWSLSFRADAAPEKTYVLLRVVLLVL